MIKNEQIMWLTTTLLSRYFFCGLLLLASLHASAQPLVIGVIGRSSNDGADITEYYEDVIRLALEKTRASHGDFIIQQRPFEASIDRVKAMLQSAAGVDVIWASVTPERLENMRHVQVDLLHDLNNYRALLVRKDDLERFKNINTLDELRVLKAGNGSNWTDTKVMQANGFVVVTAVDFGLLVKMLSAKRFDYITRGMHEVGMDLTMFSAAKLAVVPNFVLKYTAPVNYGLFVRKTDELLAKRLEQGIALAKADGSLQVLFEQVNMFQSGRKILQSNPRIIELNNSAVLQ